MRPQNPPSFSGHTSSTLTRPFLHDMRVIIVLILIFGVIMFTRSIKLTTRCQKSKRWALFASRAGGGGGSTNEVNSTPHVDLGGNLAENMGISMDRDVFLFGEKEDRMTFKQIGVHPDIARALEQCGKTTATLIQTRTFEAITNDRDIVIGAETGSGKTMAFMVPLLHRCLSRKLSEVHEEDGSEEVDISKNYPPIVIMVPNRELVLQVHAVVQQLLITLQEASGHKITSEARISQLDRWPYRDGDSPDIFICTPAILSRFIRGPTILEEEFFRHVRHMVFDEADMLLEGSYLSDVEKVLDAFRLTRRESIRRGELGINDKVLQYILSAATLPTFGLKSMDQYIAKKFPLAVRVSNDHLHRHHPQIEQRWLEVGGGGGGGITDPQRTSLVAEAVRSIATDATGSSIPGGSTMVFVNTAEAAMSLADTMRAADPPIECGEFHKLLRNTDKSATLAAFREGSLPVIVCTDSAARGLDLPAVQHVIQAEFALNVVQHLHRVGRASRGGKTGKATNIVDARGADLAASIRGKDTTTTTTGSVAESFSRKRGFRAKIKKSRRCSDSGR